jgi:hypothetical protein
MDNATFLATFWPYPYAVLSQKSKPEKQHMIQSSSFDVHFCGAPALAKTTATRILFFHCPGFQQPIN